MIVERQGRFLCIKRSETDPPVVERPYPRPTKVSPEDFNSWRDSYPISFDTEAEAIAAENKCRQLGTFAKASM